MLKLNQLEKHLNCSLFKIINFQESYIIKNKHFLVLMTLHGNERSTKKIVNKSQMVIRKNISTPRKYSRKNIEGT